MTQLFTNNAYGSLGATLSNSATSLTLASGQGARFPSPTSGDFFLLTLVGLDSNGLENAWEIVKVTGRSTDALTIERAQESTTAGTWASGTRVELRATSGTFYKFLPNDGGTLTGNLNFASGTKITGDFSNASFASRVYFQTSTANAQTVLSVLPNGTAVNSQLNLWGNSDPTNAPLGVMVVNATSVRLQSSAAGTGTILPLSFWIGASEAARFNETTRNFLIGTTTDNGTDKLQVNGSVVATSFAGSGANLTGLTSGQITTALGFTPYNATNPSGYITSSALSGYLTSASAASTYAALAGATFTGDVGHSDSAVTRAMFKDTGWDYHDSGTTNALDYTNGSVQRWAPTASSNPTLSITNWPPTGNLGELLVEAVNLAAAGTVAYPTANWIKSDGTFAASPSAAGVTFTSGTDFILFWTRDAGTTIYAKVVR